VEIRPRTLWSLVALGAAVIVMLTVLLAANEQRGAAAGRSASRAPCALAVRKLATHLESLSPEHPTIDAKIARASFRTCASPDAWDVQAQRAGVATALGRLVNDPTLEADRALDAMCTHLDPYKTTRVCTARESTSLSG
jgi:hypothetical protein